MSIRFSPVSICSCARTAQNVILYWRASQGEIRVEASEDWLLEKVDVRFNVNLASGDPSDDKLDYIVSRMKQCPVSKNLPNNIDVATGVEFHHG